MNYYETLYQLLSSGREVVDFYSNLWSGLTIIFDDESSITITAIAPFAKFGFDYDIFNTTVKDMYKNLRIFLNDNFVNAYIKYKNECIIKDIIE